MTGLVVAVTTYRRPERLRSLLRTIDALGPANGLGRVEILVVDNDPDRSASAVVEAGPERARYVHEPQPGIAAARARVLEECGNAHLVLCIDDDVVPTARWAEPLVETWRATRAAAVMGAVRYHWPDDADPWVKAGAFMRRTPMHDGDELASLATGNVLLDARQLRRLGVTFDRSLGLSGGEDTQFGRDLRAAGGRIVGCGSSVVDDFIPSERAVRPFARRRTISQGQDNQRLRMLRAGSALARGVAVAYGLAAGSVRVLRWSTMAQVARVRGDVPAHAVAVRDRWYGQGLLLGALGIGGTQYARNVTRPVRPR